MIAPPVGEETRQRLLEVAAELFALKGFSDTTVRELAKGARCNVAAISYHFGSKEKLYEVVLVRTFRELAQRRIAALQAVLTEHNGRPPLEAVLTTFARAFLDPLLTEQKAEVRLRLLLHEMVQQLLPTEIMQQELVTPVNQLLMQALASAVPQLDEDQVPLVAYSLVAQLVHVLHLQWFLPKKAELYRAYGDRLLEHIVRFTSGGISSLVSARQTQEKAS